MSFWWSRPAGVQGGATMNHLLENFDLVATAPDGIAQLRKLILELAVRGKLLPQEPNDEPASALLLNIEREKARLIKKGEIKQGNTLPAISTADIPYNLPDGWEWVRLNQIATILMGQSPESSTYNKNKEGLPFFQGKSDFGQFFPTTRTWCTDPQRIAPAGSVLISVRAPVGPTNISTEISCIGRGLSALVPLGGIAPMLLLFFIRAFESEIAKLGFGSTFVAITKTDVECFLFPLPPLSEQSRIVARVQELMAVLDRLEEQTKDAEKSREQTLLATTRALPQSPTPGALAHGWGRFSENLDHLVRRAEDVKAFRSMVLELAVRGKLVPQDNTTEPASVLLEGIKAEKSRLTSSGRIKAGKQLQTISDEEKPFKEPKGWIWARLGDLSPYGLFDGDWIESKDQDPEGKIKLIQLADILENRYLEKSNRYINDSTFQQLKCSEVLKNDILIARLPNPIGRACVFPGSIRKCITAVDIAILRSSPFINQHALALFINSPLVKEQILTYGKGATRFRIATGDLKNVMVPVPPLSLQAAIVARVQELMAVLDRLEDHLRGKEMVGSKYSETIVSLG